MDKLVRLEEGFVIIAMIVVVVAIFITVLCRYLITGAVLGIEDVSMLAGTWMYFIAAGIVTHEKTHITGGVLNLLTQNERAKACVEIITGILSMLLLIYLSVKVYEYCYGVYTHNIRTGALLLPKIYMIASVFVGGILMLFHTVVNVIYIIQKDFSVRKGVEKNSGGGQHL